MERHRLAYRPRTTFLVGVYCGCVGVLVDIDHIVCLIAGGGTWNPPAHEYGCRLWHRYLLPTAGCIGGVAIALWIGLFVGLILSTIKPTT